MPIPVFVLLGACLTMDSVSASPTDEVARTLIQSESGTYVVTYNTKPSPIPLNEMFEIQAVVREKNKKRIATHVSLEVDAGMLAHNHGMYTAPKVERRDDGSFRITGMLFHMEGEWNMVFTIKRGLMKDKAVIDLLVE